jgi:hypothetical protein
VYPHAATAKELFYIRGDNTLIAVAVRVKAASVYVGAASPLFPVAVSFGELVVNWPATLRKE